jgi:hypothetical protein
MKLAFVLLGASGCGKDWTYSQLKDKYTDVSFRNIKVSEPVKRELNITEDDKSAPCAFIPDITYLDILITLYEGKKAYSPFKEACNKALVETINKSTEDVLVFTDVRNTEELQLVKETCCDRKLYVYFCLDKRNNKEPKASDRDLTSIPMSLFDALVDDSYALLDRVSGIIDYHRKIDFMQKDAMIATGFTNYAQSLICLNESAFEKESDRMSFVAGLLEELLEYQEDRILEELGDVAAYLVLCGTLCGVTVTPEIVSRALRLNTEFDLLTVAKQLKRAVRGDYDFVGLTYSPNSFFVQVLNFIVDECQYFADLNGTTKEAILKLVLDGNIFKLQERQNKGTFTKRD